MNINLDSVSLIIGKLQELEQNFQENKALILTENDLKCQLFRLIYDLFPTSQETFSPDIKGCAVHSEVKFFDEDGKLTLVPDLIVVDTSNISIYHSTEYKIVKHVPAYKPNSSKSFTIAGGVILIELKFCRSKNGINDTDIFNYQQDVDKMIRLKEIIENKNNGQEKVYGIFVAFNKTNIGEDKFQNFNNLNNHNDEIQIFYGTGMVDFANSTQNPFNYIDDQP